MNFLKKIIVFSFISAGLFSLSAQEIEDKENEGKNESYAEIENETGVTVTANPETPAKTRTITKEEIERAHPADIVGLLEEVLGVNVTRYGPYGADASAHIRGLGAGRVAVLLDGVPVNSPQSGGFDFTALNVNAVEKIEVIYGGSDSRFNVSGAMGGIINIITIKKNKNGLRLGGGISNTAMGITPLSGLIDTQNAHIFFDKGWEKTFFSFNVFANRAENHFLFTDYYGNTRTRIDNETKDAGAGYALSCNFDDLNALAVSGNFYWGNKYIPGPMNSTNTGVQNDLSFRQNIFYTNPAFFLDDLMVEAGASYGLQIIDYTEKNSVSNHKLQTFQFINRWTWFLSELFVLKSGVDYSYINLDSSNLGAKDGHTAGFSLTSESEFGAFSLIPSIKFVFDGNSFVPAPKLGLMWKINEAFSLKNSYFRAFKLPTFNDKYWTGDSTARGNPDLRPEDGWGADIGLSYQGFFDFETSFFASWIKDSIHWRSKSGVWTPENIGSALLFGAEFFLKKNISLSENVKIIPSFSYNYLRSYILSEGFDFSANIRMPYTPEHSFSAGVDFQWKSGSAGISGRYTGLRYTETFNIVKLKPYFLLDAVVNQKTGKNMTAFLVFRNILNTSYVSVQDYPMPGLNITLGLRIDFERF